MVLQCYSYVTNNKIISSIVCPYIMDAIKLPAQTCSARLGFMLLSCYRVARVNNTWHKEGTSKKQLQHVQVKIMMLSPYMNAFVRTSIKQTWTNQRI